MPLKQEEFKQYIINKDFKDISKTINEDKIILESENHHGEVRFHFVNNFEIVELDISNKINKQSEFYLHFEYQNLEHALSLFNDFIDTIKKDEKHTIKVLFSCSAALTTSYFAMQMNEVAQNLNLDYEFNAVNYTELYKVGQDYDIILLAPQISYMLKQIQATLRNQIVEAIPPAIFANYDSVKLLKFIDDTLNNDKKKNVKRGSYKDLPEHKGAILTLSFIRNSSRIHLITNVYGKDNRLLLSKQKIFEHISLEDIYERIDLYLKLYSNIEAVGLSLGGFLQDNVVHEFFVEDLNEKNLDTLFKDKYHIPFVYSHDITCEAVGYYANHDEYNNVCVIYQPISAKGRVGYVIDGKPYNGSHNLVGDLEHFPIQLSKKYKELIKTPEGAQELFAKLAAIIDLLIDPECIVISSPLLIDPKAIKEEVSKHIKYKSADILGLDDLGYRYICYGQLALVIQELNKEA